jgi:uncharacterized protein (TIGR02611 family)
VTADNALSDQADDGARADEVYERRRVVRARLKASPALNHVYRLAVAVVGFVVLSVGIVAIPYPGPGWLIVFAGLGILASEFAWAHRLLKFVRNYYDRFMIWFSRQPIIVKAASALLTTVVVAVTLWLLGTSPSSVDGLVSTGSG